MATKEKLLYPIPDQKAENLIITKLTLLVNEQKQALQKGEFKPESIKNRKSIFSWFIESERFEQIYEKAVEFHRTPRANQETEKDKRHFGGAAYQYIAYCYLGARLPEPAVLLSPERTLELYSSLFPKADRIENPYGLDSLENISVPDGIIVNKHEDGIRIIRVCEYSLVENNPTILEGKYKAFSIDKKRIPQFLDHASLLFLLPLLPKKRSLQQMKNRLSVTILRMPFVHYQFNHFIYEIYENIPKNKL